MTITDRIPGRRGWVAALLASALALAAFGVIGFPGPSRADPTANGSDWGPTGLTTSDSALTVRWDNTSNPDTSVVFRDRRQVVPHTGGKTYADVDGKLSDTYADYFGADNGLGGMQVTVSQTQNLVNQSIQLSVSGVKGGTNVIGGNSTAYLQVFQCWGGLTSDGKPDPGSDQVDPATCQVGANGPDSRGGAYSQNQGRFIGQDLLARGGDWASYYSSTTSDVPFTAIDGETSGSTIGTNNQFFNATTTNELSNVVISADGTASRPFEAQTGVEAPGMGCGRRPEVVSTATCWLVIVPRISGQFDTSGPIAPSIWAQRIQIRLGFRELASTCPGGQARTLLGGSEMLTDATSSWIPGLCDSLDIGLGYTQLGDEVARTQFEEGSNTAILTSQPIPDATPAIHVPVALTAPVIAYSLTYLPTCVDADPVPATDAAARNCGYDDLADLQQDWKRAGTPVRDLKLDARLVAKLLTQSYQFSIMQNRGMERTGWMLTQNNGADRPIALAEDPEFTRLNPSLAHQNVSGSSPALKIDHLLVEALRSDGAAAIWTWLLADPEASAFLSGCPDPDGMTINPFYSTRTYRGCQSQKATLEARAAADRAATQVSPDYVDTALRYPPDGTPYPLPTWQQYSAEGISPQTVVDWLPPSASMPVAGRNVAIGYLPKNSDWCATALNASCLPSPGKWLDPKVRQSTGSLGLMGITDAATAARFQLATASLCDASGEDCVGASTDSLRAAARSFVKDDQGLFIAGAPDYAAGAYPLTQPVYAAVSPTLDQAARTTLATALGYVVSTGQRPGFEAGELPPGYAPLTTNLSELATRSIADLRRADPAPTSTDSPTDSPTPATEPSGPPQDTPGSAPVPSAPGVPGTGPQQQDQSTEPDSDPAGGSDQDQPMVTVAASREHWPGYTLPAMLLGALIASAAGVLLRFRGWIRIGGA